MNVVSYIRVSGRGQLAGGGPDRQRDSIHVFASTNNLTNAREFFEQGISGTTRGMDRPAFSEMLEYIEDHETDNFSIVVERMDRLARDLMRGEMLLKECRDRGIKVFAADVGLIDQATNDGDPTRKLIRQVIGAVAEFAKSELVMKLAKARKRQREKTGKCEGAKSYGHYPAELPAMEFVKGLILSDADLRGESVASLLNQGGFRTRRGTNYSRQAAERVVKTVKQRISK